MGFLKYNVRIGDGYFVQPEVARFSPAAGLHVPVLGADPLVSGNKCLHFLSFLLLLFRFRLGNV